MIHPLPSTPSFFLQKPIPLSNWTGLTPRIVLIWASIAFGSLVFVGGGIVGAIVLGKTFLSTAIGAKLYAIALALFPAAKFLLLFSAAILMAPATAWGAVYTLPVAGAIFALPFLPAAAGFFIGAAPGAAIVQQSLRLLQKV